MVELCRVADPVGRQTVLGLVVPGLLCLVAGTVCAFYAFLVGVSLIVFGALLLLLPALACRILKSLPDQYSPEDGNSKKESQRNIARDARPTYGSRYAAAAYVNPAFEPKEAMGDDATTGYSRVSAISCSRLQRPEKQQSQNGKKERPLSPRQCQTKNGTPRRYASTNSLAAELHSACRYQQGGTKEPPRRMSPDGHTGFRHIEFDQESARFGERPPRYSTVVRESPLI